jgi:protein TonB
MNQRFPVLVLISIALHVCVIWAITGDSPPRLRVKQGEISIDCLPGPAVAARPQTTKTENQPVEKVKPAPPVPEKQPEVKKPVPEKPKEVPQPVKPPPLLPPTPKPDEEKPRPKVERPAPPAKPQEKPAPKPLPTVDTPSVATSSSMPSVPQMQGVKSEARALGNPKFAYPEEARQLGLEGMVVLALDISAEGRVVKASVQTSSGYRILDDAALRDARSLEFEPARQGGTPIPTTIFQPVRYRLRDIR